MITYAVHNTTLLLVVLAVLALFAAYPVTKALTVMQVGPTRSRGAAMTTFDDDRDGLAVGGRGGDAAPTAPDRGPGA